MLNYSNSYTYFFIEEETRDGAIIKTILPTNLTLRRSFIDLIVVLGIITTTFSRLTK
jgi:hypothetical protein